MKIFINDKLIFSKLITKLTIIEFCKNLGIFIPHFCYNFTLSIAGNCRICIIEVFKMIKPIISCLNIVIENLRIYTNSFKLKKLRENVMEFLLLNHPLDCPICDQAGECDLQEQTLFFGLDRSRFLINKKTNIDFFISNEIKIVLNRCILCLRCVRFLNEFNLKTTNVLGNIGRGYNSKIHTYVGKFLNLSLSMNIIDLCPVSFINFNLIKRNFSIENKRKEKLSKFLYNLFIMKYEYEGIFYKHSKQMKNSLLNSSYILDKDHYNKYLKTFEARIPLLLNLVYEEPNEDLKTLDSNLDYENLNIKNLNFNLCEYDKYKKLKLTLKPALKKKHKLIKELFQDYLNEQFFNDKSKDYDHSDLKPINYYEFRFPEPETDDEFNKLEKKVLDNKLPTETEYSDDILYEGGEDIKDSEGNIIQFSVRSDDRYLANLTSVVQTPELDEFDRLPFIKELKHEAHINNLNKTCHGNIIINEIELTNFDYKALLNSSYFKYFIQFLVETLGFYWNIFSKEHLLKLLDYYVLNNIELNKKYQNSEILVNVLCNFLPNFQNLVPYKKTSTTNYIDLKQNKNYNLKQLIAVDNYPIELVSLNYQHLIIKPFNFIFYSFFKYFDIQYYNAVEKVFFFHASLKSNNTQWIIFFGSILLYERNLFVKTIQDYLFSKCLPCEFLTELYLPENPKLKDSELDLELCTNFNPFSNKYPKIEFNNEYSLFENIIEDETINFYINDFYTYNDPKSKVLTTDESKLFLLNIESKSIFTLSSLREFLNLKPDVFNIHTMAKYYNLSDLAANLNYLQSNQYNAISVSYDSITCVENDLSIFKDKGSKNKGINMEAIKKIDELEIDDTKEIENNTSVDIYYLQEFYNYLFLYYFQEEAKFIVLYAIDKEDRNSKFIICKLNDFYFSRLELIHQIINVSFWEFTFDFKKIKLSTYLCEPNETIDTATNYIYNFNSLNYTDFEIINEDIPTDDKFIVINMDKKEISTYSEFRKAQRSRKMKFIPSIIGRFYSTINNSSNMDEIVQYIYVDNDYCINVYKSDFNERAYFTLPKSSLISNEDYDKAKKALMSNVKEDLDKDGYNSEESNLDELSEFESNEYNDANEYGNDYYYSNTDSEIFDEYCSEYIKLKKILESRYKFVRVDSIEYDIYSKIIKNNKKYEIVSSIYDTDLFNKLKKNEVSFIHFTNTPKPIDKSNLFTNEQLKNLEINNKIHSNFDTSSTISELDSEYLQSSLYLSEIDNTKSQVYIVDGEKIDLNYIENKVFSNVLSTQYDLEENDKFLKSIFKTYKSKGKEKKNLDLDRNEVSLPDTDESFSYEEEEKSESETVSSSSDSEDENTEETSSSGEDEEKPKSPIYVEAIVEEKKNNENNDNDKDEEDDLDLKPIGALTLKIKQFIGRPWELVNFSFFDIFDIFALPIQLYYKFNTLIRILPQCDSLFKLEIISDQTRLISNFFKINNNNFLEDSYLFNFNNNFLISIFTNDFFLGNFNLKNTFNNFFVNYKSCFLDFNLVTYKNNFFIIQENFLKNLNKNFSIFINVNLQKSLIRFFIKLYILLKDFKNIYLYKNEDLNFINLNSFLNTVQPLNKNCLIISSNVPYFFYISNIYFFFKNLNYIYNLIDLEINYKFKFNLFVLLDYSNLKLIIINYKNLNIINFILEFYLYNLFEFILEYKLDFFNIIGINYIKHLLLIYFVNQIYLSLNIRFYKYF